MLIHFRKLCRSWRKRERGWLWGFLEFVVLASSTGVLTKCCSPLMMEQGPQYPYWSCTGLAVMLTHLAVVFSGVAFRARRIAGVKEHICQIVLSVRDCTGDWILDFLLIRQALDNWVIHMAICWIVLSPIPPSSFPILKLLAADYKKGLYTEDLVSLCRPLSDSCCFVFIQILSCTYKIPFPCMWPEPSMNKLSWLNHWTHFPYLKNYFPLLLAMHRLLKSAVFCIISILFVSSWK